MRRQPPVSKSINYKIQWFMDYYFKIS